MSNPAPVAVALDAPDLETAARWAALVTPHVSTVKVGLELYLRYGPEVVATVRGASRVSVFLDLKLHDIPATVAGARGPWRGCARRCSPCTRPGVPTSSARPSRRHRARWWRRSPCSPRSATTTSPSSG